MIRPILKTRLIFARAAADATAADAAIVQDLLDTLAAHAHECVGLAANMIGHAKRIICFDDHGRGRVMFNPVIERASGEYQAEESCLSLAGARPCTRYRSITVAYQELVDGELRDRRARFTGFTAQIIQHEIDHTNGVVI